MALLETNPYLLGLTIVVSIVHSIFEFLAFKNGEFNVGIDQYVFMLRNWDADNR